MRHLRASESRNESLRRHLRRRAAQRGLESRAGSCGQLCLARLRNIIESDVNRVLLGALRRKRLREGQKPRVRVGSRGLDGSGKIRRRAGAGVLVLRQALAVEDALDQGQLLLRELRRIGRGQLDTGLDALRDAVLERGRDADIDQAELCGEGRRELRCADLAKQPDLWRRNARLRCRVVGVTRVRIVRAVAATERRCSEPGKGPGGG